MAEEEIVNDETPTIEPDVSAVSKGQIWANRLRFFLLGVTIVCLAGVSYLVFTYGITSPAERVDIPTRTPSTTPTVSATLTSTPTARPPTMTPTPGPTHTPLPPFRYIVQPRDTWLGLAINYDIDLDSLLDANDWTNSDYIVEGEEILIPYPTYTATPAASPLPTFEVVGDISRDQCREHTIATGETLISIAIKYEVSVQLIQSVNNISNPDLVKEGQKLCIPLVTPGPAPSPTFGPTPTPAEEPLHLAPQLLSPPNGVEIQPGTTQVHLQWTVSGFMDEDEYYMVEIRNLNRPNSRAVRGFSKTTSWQMPDSMYPSAGIIETFSWRVSIVRGTGDPTGENFQWERSGLPSDWHSFMWMGLEQDSLPTPTPE
ncbi:MAG: LysM peptidoglycan-binding domain-containing protein [Anaerolineales bacterium]|nr:LysM peptidoglycan-binding domain-containing protein [Anaerolineales bacterium]